MKNNILEHFLDAIDVKYTKEFADTLFYEHPHKNNMLGLKQMLDVYGVETVGVSIDSKELKELNFPCILHINGDFIIGLSCATDSITYLQHGKETTVSHDVFKQLWTNKALVIRDTTEAIEPDYREHLRNELISRMKKYGIPIMLTLVVAIGLLNNIEKIDILYTTRIVLSSLGLLVCLMLMEKQLFEESRYGDRVCSLFRHTDCNSVLDGAMAKVLGVSWSEMGLGYFVANILLLSLFPTSSCTVAAINWAAMLYGVWSIYYQWRIAKSWCVLCMITQIIIWTMGIVSIIMYLSEPFAFDIITDSLYCIVFAISILYVHQYAMANAADKKRTRAIQQYRALKVNSDVAKALIEKSEFYETSLNDSSIIFGNHNAAMRVTILSNPHCNPCARMHKKVETLLKQSRNEICVQYIFSSFNEQLEDSSRYLISNYFNNHKDEALSKFALWYTNEKFDYERIIKSNNEQIHTEAVEKEMEKHRIWREKTSLIATPTVLVNGYKLPSEYELIDLAMIANITIKEKNILQDNNGRSTTPLGAELKTAE